MTEYNLFTECIPEIAQIAVKCSRMAGQEYETWKRKVMQVELQSANGTAKRFMKKVLIVIDSYVHKNIVNA